MSLKVHSSIRLRVEDLSVLGIVPRVCSKRSGWFRVSRLISFLFRTRPEGIFFFFFFSEPNSRNERTSDMFVAAEFGAFDVFATIIRSTLREVKNKKNPTRTERERRLLKEWTVYAIKTDAGHSFNVIICFKKKNNQKKKPFQKKKKKKEKNPQQNCINIFQRNVYYLPFIFLKHVKKRWINCNDLTKFEKKRDLKTLSCWRYECLKVNAYLPDLKKKKKGGKKSSLQIGEKTKHMKRRKKKYV